MINGTIYILKQLNYDTLRENVLTPFPIVISFTAYLFYESMFYCMYCRVLIFVLSPVYISLYNVLGDDISIIDGSFMRIKHLFVLIHIRNIGEIGTIKQV